MSISTLQGNTHTDKKEVLKCLKGHIAHLNTASNTSPDPPPFAVDKIPGTPEETDDRKGPRYRQYHSRGPQSGWEAHDRNVPQSIQRHLGAGERLWPHVSHPIHKKSDKRNPGNYRAMSLLYIPGKVFSRILLNRMKLKTKETRLEQIWLQTRTRHGRRHIRS